MLTVDRLVGPQFARHTLHSVADARTVTATLEPLDPQTAVVIGAGRS